MWSGRVQLERSAGDFAVLAVLGWLVALLFVYAAYRVYHAELTPAGSVACMLWG